MLLQSAGTILQECRHFRLIINSGAKSERFVKKEYPGLPAQAFVHYGNFIGAAIQRYAKALVDTIVATDYDGLDIDWEPDNGSSTLRIPEATSSTVLLLPLRSDLLPADLLMNI